MVMSNIQENLNNLIEKCNINFYEDEISEELNKNNSSIINQIKNIWNDIDKNSKLAIYGAGNHTEKLFEIVDKNDKNIVCVIDNLRKNETIYEYPLISRENMKDYNIDSVLISTLGYLEEIKEDVSKNFPNIKIIDLYSELKKNGHGTNKPFYYEKDSEIYTKIHKLKKLYEEKECEKYLINLIYKYITIRDFFYAQKYIDEYIYKNYIQVDLVKELDLNIKNINENIKKILTTKSKSDNKNGLVLLLDSLRNKDIYINKNMKFLSEISSESINCTNAYTHVPYTSMSILSMITEKKFMDDDLLNVEYPIKNIGMLKRIKEINYNFRYYGNQVRYFDKNKCNNNGELISQMFWNYVCDCCSDNNNNISIIHAMETHAPYIGGYHKDIPVDFQQYSQEKITNKSIKLKKQQRTEMLEYVDNQIKYYFDLISINTNVIITSDHGNIIEYDINSNNDNYYTQDMINIPYIIYGDGIKYNEVDQLISHLDTSKIIVNTVIDTNEIFNSIEKRYIIEVNRDFTYSKFNLEKIKEFDKVHLGRAFKCFNTKKYKYVIFFDGKEEFYSLNNEDKNLINNIEFSETIKKIKEKINVEFPDFNEHRFRYAKEIYKF